MNCKYTGKYYLGDTVLYKRGSSFLKAQIFKVDVDCKSGECRYHMSNTFKPVVITDDDIVRLVEGGIERQLSCCF